MCDRKRGQKGAVHSYILIIYMTTLLPSRNKLPTLINSANYVRSLISGICKWRGTAATCFSLFFFLAPFFGVHDGNVENTTARY